jgi:iron complex outermembrane receptor protein
VLTRASQSVRVVVVSLRWRSSSRAGASMVLPRLLLMSSLALRLSLYPWSARADEYPNEIPAVIVTANRTEENAQDIPIDVSVVTGALANGIGITDTQALAASVPGLLFNRQANTAIPFIRGVGSPVGQAGDEPSVAFYVDDVYEPAAAASLANFTSLERIEVEKGPQGTVFGRNATGGVVQVFTRDPTPDPSMDLSVGVANYDTKSGALYATGAVSQTLTGNVSLYGAQQSDGWGRDVLTGASIYTGWDYGGRAKLLWTLSDRTSALLSVDYDDTSTGEGTNVRAFPGTTSLNPLPTAGGFPPPADYYDTNGLPATHSITYQSGVSLKLLHDLDWAHFVSITAWRDTNAVEGIDEDPGIELANAIVATQEHTWTQELRLTSATQSKTTWIAGLFYYHDVAGYDPLYLYGLAFLPQPFIDTFGFQTTDSWSGFGQAKQEILPKTNLTLGIRYTTDHRRLDAAAASGLGPEIPAVNSPQSATWSQPTYRVAIDHHFTDDIMGYLAYNRGFKSGLFNPLVLPGAPIVSPVAPETLDAYTVGEKAEFLGHMLLVNLEGFYYHYKDIQIQEIVSGSTFITNAAAATIRGIDIDAAMTPVARLTISASMEILSGHYDSFANGQFYVYNSQAGGNCLFSAAGSCSAAVLPPNYNAATNSWNLSGDHTVETPPFSASLIVQEEIPSVVGTFKLSGSWTHTGNYYADADNGLGQVTPSSRNNDRQGPVNLLSGSVSWNSLDHQWQILAWGKNLTDVHYWSYAQEVVFVTQYSAAPPRTFGVTLSRHW